MESQPLRLVSDPSRVHENVLHHNLTDYFEILGSLGSTKKLFKFSLYQKLKNQIECVLTGLEYGFYAPKISLEKKDFYRAVAWNIERGLHFEGILWVLKNHPFLSKADLLLLTETDIGMVRTQNQNVAKELAAALGYHYFFAPAYLNLCKGNSVEKNIEGQNTLGLHGNALLSRYPLENLRAIPLKNCKDKMKGREKRIGCQKALVAEVSLPSQKITVVVAHLDAHSSQKQRALQMETILKAVDATPYPVLLGGDLNTNTYNSRHAFFAFCGFWHKVFLGVDHVIDEHYPNPDRYFERFLFEMFSKYGYRYDHVNEQGVGTLHYQVKDMRGNHLIQEVVPAWCRKVMEKTLSRHGGRVSLKLDWFASRGIKPAHSDLARASPPKVIPSLKYLGRALSDHDPILLDFDPYVSR